MNSGQEEVEARPPVRNIPINCSSICGGPFLRFFLPLIVGLPHTVNYHIQWHLAILVKTHFLVLVLGLCCDAGNLSCAVLVCLVSDIVYIRVVDMAGNELKSLI